MSNRSVEEDDFGSLWTTTALFWHLERTGVDVNRIWSQLYDLILKTVMLGEPSNFDFL